VVPYHCPVAWISSCFNPRPCARGDQVPLECSECHQMFQSTPLREGRRIYFLDGHLYMRFNPRPCARGDISFAALGSISSSFNPRPCARGDKLFACTSFDVKCFNPRPCARGDDIPRVKEANPRVSIHAPARGATDAAPDMLYALTGFNPRPCARGDFHFSMVHFIP